MLFFDLDDTLVDDSGAAAAAVRALYVAYRDRIQDSLEAFTSRWRLAGRVAFTAYLEGHVLVNLPYLELLTAKAQIT